MSLEVDRILLPLRVPRHLPRLALIVVGIAIVTVAHFNLLLQSLIDSQVLRLVARER